MKLIKDYEPDKRSKYFMLLFDEVFSSFYFPWRLETLEVILCEEDKVILEGKRAKIYFDKDNDFIRSMDEKGIKITILHGLYKLILKINGLDYENFYSKNEEERKIIRILEDFIVDRELAKNYGDLVFYKKCYEAIKIEAKDFVGWIKANLLWLIFHGIDDWNAEFLKNIVEKRVEYLDYEFLERLCEIIEFFSEDIKTKEGIEKILTEIINWKK
jgi:hypothetical protein